MKWITEKIDFLKHCVKGAVESAVYSIDNNFFAQCSCQSSSFFHHVRSIKESTMFYALKANIPNWAKKISENLNLVKFNLYVIYNFYDTTSYELTSAIITRLNMNAFMNRLNKRALIKSISQVNIFTKVSFSV